MADTLHCPNCRFEIEVSTVFAAQIREHLRQEYEQEYAHEIEMRLAQEKAQLRQDAEIHARERLSLEIGDLQDQLTAAQTKAADAQQAELQLRKERRELEAQKQELELTVNRQLDEERQAIRVEAKREADEENRLRDADRDKLVADLRRQIDDLKRKSEQGVPQVQGEIMELQLEDLLRRHFPLDTIEPVPASYPGGDVLQHVHDSTGQACGTILWEAKRTKAWNDAWLPKLRHDQRAARAHLAVLASMEMPKGLATFGYVDGVWVTSRICLVNLTVALRAGLLEVARTKRSLEGKQTKVELIYNYFSGPEFSQKIAGIVEAFMTMKEDLESEKRSLQRIWAKREKQLERAALNTAGLYGDLGGLLDTPLPPIANLELAAIAADAEVPEWESVTVGADDWPF